MGAAQMVALRIAMVALAVSFFGGLVFAGLRSPILLVLVPTLAAAAWLYRRELRAGGWWTVGVAILVASGLVLFMVSPSYLGQCFLRRRRGIFLQPGASPRTAGSTAGA